MSDTGNVHLIKPPYRAVARPECTVKSCIEVAGYVMPHVRLDAHSGYSGKSSTEYLADPLNWEHVLACEMHKNGWWDGDDPIAADYPLANPAGYVITPNPRMETSS